MSTPTRNVLVQQRLVAVLLGGVCAPAAASPSLVFTDVPSIAVSSSGVGQLSTSLYRQSIVTGHVLQVDYIAPSAHCSSVKMHFRVDGHEVATTGAIAPGSHSGYHDLGPVSPGAHELALQAEGLEGGCNHGTLQSWSGELKVLTSSPADDPGAPAGLGEIIFEQTLVNFAWGYVDQGCYISADGAVFHFEYARGDSHWRPDRAPDGSLSPAELQEHYAHNATQTGQISRDEIASRIDALRAAARGSIRERHSAYDAGALSIQGWLLDAGAQRYRPVLLSQSGDFERTNDSSQVKPLLTWVKSALSAGKCRP